MITLAVFEGFWGQVFEYLPFAFTVAVTVIFGLITLVYDFLWRREVRPPPGALPRIHIPIDPRIAPRRWLNRGKTAAKFGCGFGIFTGFLFTSFAINPPGVGAQYGLEQEPNRWLVAGACLALGASIVGFGATIYLQRRPWQEAGTLALVAFLASFGPFLTTWDTRWLGVGLAVMGIPVGFIVLGVIYMVHGLRISSEVEARREVPESSGSS